MNSTDSGRDPFEELAEDFLTRYRAGERPSVSEYARLHPGLADQIRDLLPALVEMEEVRPGKGGPAGAPAGEGAAPERLGEYRILREVGRGGMGVVYEAVQESLGRHVALKALPLSGLLGPTYRERFRREARAAARLHHTNIVPVFGVGEHQGVHFYAMQFIRGQGLDVVLEEVKRLRGGQGPAAPVGAPDRPAASAAAGLLSGQLSGEAGAPAAPTAAVAQASTWVSGGRSEAEYCRGVARLGVQAAEALAYAHRHGVLHRDIKPSNLLLDTHGTVWVTDFGLAKVEGADDLTSPGDLVGTLRFMAPERLRGQSDARGDVYSLGLTLYELLTLQPAFADADRARLTERVAREEPPRPRQLNPHIPRDLETVILKATAKEPARRYPSAEALAEDLGRFLADQPIRARRAGAWERAVKWAKRRPAATALLAVTGLAALSLLAGVLWHNARLAAKIHEVEEQQRKSHEEAKRADANFTKTLEAVDKFLSQIGHQRLAQIPGMEQVRQEVLDEALRFFQGFLQEKGSEPCVRREAGRAYFRVGHIHNLLGQHDQAESAYRRALELLEPLPADPPVVGEYRDDLARTHHSLGHLLRATGRPREAEASYRRAVALWEELMAELPTKEGYRYGLAGSHINLGVLLESTGRPQEAEPVYRRALELAERLAADFPAEPDHRRFLAASHLNLGALLKRAGRPHDAEQALRQALELSEKLVTQFPRQPEYLSNLAGCHTNLGSLFHASGRLEEAVEQLRRAVAVCQQLADESPIVPDYQNRLASCHYNLAILLEQTDRPQEAEAAYRRAREVFEKLVAGSPAVPDYRHLLGAILNNLSRYPNERGELVEARQLLEQAIEHQGLALKSNPRHPRYREFLANHYRSLADILIGLGEHGGAAKIAAEAPGLFPDSWQECVRAAECLASCVPLAEKDARLPEGRRRTLAQAYADRAMAWLHDAAAKGCKDPEQLTKPREFDPLRGRADFQDLVRTLEDKAKMK